MKRSRYLIIPCLIVAIGFATGCGPAPRNPAPAPIPENVQKAKARNEALRDLEQMRLENERRQELAEAFRGQEELYRKYEDERLKKLAEERKIRIEVAGVWANNSLHPLFKAAALLSFGVRP
jgi:hypothetical protein